MQIGILGAGQLGRMLALAGYPLGLRFRFFDPTPDAPAGQLAEQIVADFRDSAALARFASGLAVVSYEFENVPLAAVEQLARLLPVYPPPAALATAQARLVEKRLVQRLGFAVPPFAAVHSRADLDRAVAAIGLPAILKTNTLGYDGKGQALLQTPADLEPAWARLGQVALILEGYVNFDRELSLIAVRGRDGACAFYPLIANQHVSGILHRSLAPAPALSPGLQNQAEQLAHAIMAELEYVGVLAIELFQQGERLLFNEMAPRVHNSGHWTIEGATTSQFENQLRALLGLPLGATTPRGVSVMLNLIGEIPPIASVLALPGGHLHLYGKAARPGRKLGHITLCAADADQLQQQLHLLQAALAHPGA